LVEVREYIDANDRSPFGSWFAGLNAPAAAKVTTALTRIELGNLSNFKPVDFGVLEYRIDFGPGYRIYFGKDGDHLVILLGGGTKKRQQKDIMAAHVRWQDYKRRKKQER
jgi:putative addiction module killer protein